MEGGFLPEPEHPAWKIPQRQQHWNQQPPTTQQQPTAAQQQHWAPPPHTAAAAAAAPPGRYVPPSAAPFELPPPGSDALLEAQDGCSRCSSLSFNSEWLKAFNVVLCSQCKWNEPLISKSTAKQRYSLSDSDLSRLGSLRKSNPHKKDWQAMHLFMESQVARVAHDKYGGAEGLQQHQLTKVEAQMEGKLKRRAEEKRREAAEAARLERIRQRISEEQQGRQREEVAGAAASGSDVEEI